MWSLFIGAIFHYESAYCYVIIRLFVIVMQGLFYLKSRLPTPTKFDEKATSHIAGFISYRPSVPV